MPIFGNLYHLPVYVSEDLLEDKDIHFNAGNHAQAIKMKTRDFLRLAKPTILKIIHRSEPVALRAFSPTAGRQGLLANRLASP